METISRQTQILLLMDEVDWGKKYDLLDVRFDSCGYPTEATVDYYRLQYHLVWNEKRLPAEDWSRIVDENYVPVRANQLVYNDRRLDCSLDLPHFQRFVQIMQAEIMGINVN
jgi:hypothetical protein